jgi:hypothetical protein
MHCSSFLFGCKWSVVADVLVVITVVLGNKQVCVCVFVDRSLCLYMSDLWLYYLVGFAVFVGCLLRVSVVNRFV